MRLSDEEKEQLANENFAYIHYFSKKYHTPQWDYEELVGAATLGMTKALNTFNKSKGIKFSTYSARCVINAIFMFMRKEKKHLYNVSIEQSLVTDKDGSELTILDTLAAPEREIDWREISPSVNKVLSNLSERDRNIMLMFFENKTQREIGDSFDLSQSYITRIIGKALKQIKAIYWRGEEDMANKTKLQISVEEFVSLRYKEKRTLAEIAQTKGVAEATIHYWKNNNSEEIQRVLEMLKLSDKAGGNENNESKIQEMNQVIADLKADLQTKETYIDSRESLIDTLESKVVDLEKTKHIYEAAEKENQSIRDENEKLKKMNAEQDFSIRQLERLANENRDLKQEIEALKFFARRYLAV